MIWRSKVSVNLSPVLAWPGSSELDEQRSRPLQVDLIDRIMFVWILIVPTTSSTDPLPLAIDLKTEAKTQTQWLKIKVLYKKTHMIYLLLRRCVWITYPFGLSEWIRDLGEGEFASRVHLCKETKTVILRWTWGGQTKEIRLADRV